MSTYAADTNVSSEKSRGEIERTLSRYGAHIVFHSYGCWEWVGPVNANGYALLGNGQTGHRYFYQVFRGEIPDDLVLDHVCHTTLCPGGPTPLKEAQRLLAGARSQFGNDHPAYPLFKTAIDQTYEVERAIQGWWP